MVCLVIEYISWYRDGRYYFLIEPLYCGSETRRQASSHDRVEGTS